MSSIFKVLAFIPSDILKDTDDKIYIGKVINSYSENQEKYIIILLNSEKGDIRQLKNVPIETMKLLALWNQTKFVIINHSFYGKYSKRKERQLKKIIELSKEDPTLLISYIAPFEKFFKDKHFYNDVIKTYHKRVYKEAKSKLKNIIKALLNLFFGDLFVYTNKYISITNLESKIKNEKFLVKQGLLGQNDQEARKKKINDYKKEIEELKGKQQDSSRGFTTLLISILTLCIYTQQCKIAKKQTILQENQTTILEKQLNMERNLNLPKFNIYVSYSDDSKSESIYIKQINNAYLSTFLFQQSIICQIRTKDNKIIFKRITDYYKEALFSIEDKYGKYGLIGSGNVEEWNKIKTAAEGIIESIELERIIKLTYTDYENNNHEQYFFVIPVLGANEWDDKLGEHFFDKKIEDFTMEQLLEYLKTMNAKQRGETVIEKGNSGN